MVTNLVRDKTRIINLYENVAIDTRKYFIAAHKLYNFQ